MIQMIFLQVYQIILLKVKFLNLKVLGLSDLNSEEFIKYKELKNLKKEDFEKKNYLISDLIKNTREEDCFNNILNKNENNFVNYNDDQELYRINQNNDEIFNKLFKEDFNNYGYDFIDSIMEEEKIPNP